MARTVVVAALLALAGCAAVDYVTEHGQVFECRATSGDVLELCTDLGRIGLEQATGWTCAPTRRLWPALTGCIYSCEPHEGCNALSGCYCPEIGADSGLR